MPSILITGANRGLGLEFVKQYAAEGYRVFATAREPKRAPELADLAHSHGSISVHPLEVTDATSVRKLAQELAAEPLDILLNNAGVMGPKRQSFGEIDFDGMLDTLNINAVAPLRIAEAFVDNVAKGSRKLIVGITSGMGSIAETSGDSYAYRASKAALNMGFRNLAIDLRQRNITTVVISPGWVRTDMGGKGAPVEVGDAISAMRKVFDNLTISDTGKFLDYAGGTWAW
jgi:NAD(P)-dependent dehydrogenase (short-subunit alcohol dehydrogenase family)